MTGTHHYPQLLLVKMGLLNFISRLVLTLGPPDLCLPRMSHHTWIIYVLSYYVESYIVTQEEPVKHIEVIRQIAQIRKQSRKLGFHIA
jgi:hypothetical protein